jgi:death-on-curing protein
VTNFLDREDVLTASAAALGHVPDVADYGLLDSAVARPSSTVLGLDAYPSLFTKAAALLQSLARNHALVDGNKRTAWAASWTFLMINGRELAPSYDVDAAEKLMLDVATGRAQSVDDIAGALEGFAGGNGP